jgi:hypothetical protein
MAGRIPLSRIRSIVPDLRGLITDGLQKGISIIYNIAQKAIDFEILVDDETISINGYNKLYAIDASIEQKGIVQLSNSYENNSESLAVTEKALSSGLSNLNVFEWIEGGDGDGILDDSTSLVPTMTSQTEPSGTCFQSSYYTTYPLPAYKAFDGITGSFANAWMSETYTYSSSTGEGNEYMGYIFPSPVIIGGYSITAREYQPNAEVDPMDFIFEISSDTTTGHNGTWTAIDSQSNISWDPNEIKTFKTDNITSCIAFRLRVTKILDAAITRTNVAELEVHEWITPPSGGVIYPETPIENKTIVINTVTNTIEYWNGSEWIIITDKSKAYDVIDSDTELTSSYNDIEIDTTNNAVQLTLPDASSIKPHEFNIYFGTKGDDTFTIITSGTDTFDGTNTSIEIMNERDWLQIKATSFGYMLGVTPPDAVLSNGV